MFNIIIKRVVHMNKTNLKERLTKNKLLCAIGVYNPLTAMLVEDAGFECIYMTGYGVAMGNHGYPDIGLVTMSEMVEVAKRITDRTSLPLIADADTGYGTSLNVVRTIKEYERAGVNAIQIEDQVWPKRCGHMSGKSVIPKEEMRAKIFAAVDSRQREDTLIIARTDVLAIEGIDAAIERGNLFADWGADVVFVEAPTDPRMLERIPAEILAHTLINLAPNTPNLTTTEIEKMGFDVAIYPGISITATYEACVKELSLLKETGKQENMSYWKDNFSKMNELVGLSTYRELEEIYLK
jgi:2-methylisocitrate lyase-like PEP mutase family enzyme